MPRKQQDDGQAGGKHGTRQPLDAEERRRQRQLLAERIGQLLARHWLRSRHSQEDCSSREPVTPETDSGEP